MCNCPGGLSSIIALKYDEEWGGVGGRGVPENKFLLYREYVMVMAFFHSIRFVVCGRKVGVC